MENTPEARIVASFTLMVTLLLGAWQAVPGLTFSPALPFQARELGVTVAALLPIAATVVAYLSARSTQAAWARTLGSATVMLGALASLGAVLWLLANW